LPTSVSTIPLS